MLSYEGGLDLWGSAWWHSGLWWTWWRIFFFNVQGSVHRKYNPFDIFPTRCNTTQFIYFWKTALHVSGGISTHHQELIQLYLQYLVLVKPLILPPLLWKSWNWFECGVGMVMICFGAVATAPKQINTIPKPHSNKFKLFHNRGGSSNGLTSTRYCK